MVARFGLVARFEATTYLTLLLALVWRLLADGPDLSRVTGPLHGIAFIAYLVTVASCRAEYGWSTRSMIVVLAAAVVPLGGYVIADRHVDRIMR